MPSEIINFIHSVQQSQNVNKRVIPRSPAWLYPMPAERQYQRELIRFVKRMEKLTNTILIPELPLLTAAYKEETRPVIDTWADDTELILRRLELGFEENLSTVTGLASEIGFKVNRWNERQFQKTVKQVLGVNIFIPEPWLEAELTSFANTNATLIKSISDDFYTEISGITQRGLTGGKRHEQIAKEIKKRYGVTENRAKLIARDQVNKLNGNLTQLRQESIGIKSYIWQTAQDERVRPSHQANQGVEFKWNNPPDTGHPGEDIQCRCVAEPVFTKEYLRKAA